MVSAIKEILRQGLALALALLLLCQPGYAAFSPQSTAAPGSVASGVNYQGRLEEGGFPVTGARNVTFRVYDAASGGTLLWNSGAQAVVVTQGLFNTAINIPVPALNGGGARYLEVTIESDTLSPRELLGAVPYALVAKSVEGVLDVSNGGLNIASSSGGGPALFISSATGNVGMGSTSPGSTRLWIQGAAAESFHLRVSSQNSTGSLLVVAADGNVGIGTSNPLAALHIASGGIRFQDGSFQASAGVGSASGVANNADALVNGDADANGAGAARIQTRGLDRVYVESAGSVGVGLTNPASTLDVEGAARFGTAASKSIFSSAGALTIASGADIALSGGSKVTGLAAPGVGGDAANKTYVDAQVVAASGWTDDGAVTRLTSADRVGIGSTSPGAAKFWVQGLGADDFHVRVSSQDGTGTLLVVDRLGRIGAGVAAPAYKLDVRGDAGFGSTGTQSVFSGTGALAIAANADITLSGTGKITGLPAPTVPSEAANKAYVDAQIPGAGGWTDDGAVTRLTSATDRLGVGTTSPGSAKMWVQGQAGDAFHLRVSSQDATGSLLVVTSTGNVGVGTSNPGARLEVSGGQAYLHSTPASVVPLHVRSDSGSGTAAIFADTGGNVGIGTSDPQATLEVKNTVRIHDGGANHKGVIQLGLGDVILENNPASTNIGDFQIQSWNGSGYNIPLKIMGATGNLGVGTTSPSTLFQVGAATLAATAAGSVGVGTTSPLSRLNVFNGDIRISTSAGASNRGIIFEDGSVQITAAGTSLWSSNGPDIYNGGAGNVGVGTSSPAKPLHVYSNVATPFQPLMESGRSDYPGMLLVKNAVSTLSVGVENNVGGALMTGAAANSAGIAHQGAGKLHFGTANTVRMTVDSAGRVGIGTASPSTALLLDVEGKAGFGTGVDKSSFTATGDLIMATNANITLSGIGRVTGLFTPASPSDAATKSYVDAQVLAASGWTDSGAVVRLTTIADRLGVGTTSPAAKLSVQGQAADPFHLQISSQDATSLLVLDKNGNLGVGTTSPRGKLDIAVAGSEGHVFGLDKLVGYDDLRFFSDEAGTVEHMRLLGTGGLSIGTAYVGSDAGAGSVIIQNNAGIGTTAPSGPLQIGDPAGVDAVRFGTAASNARHHLISNRDLVMDAFDYNAGTTNTPIFLVRQDTAKFDESATTARLAVTDLGRVGVNTEAPAVALDVRGDASFGNAGTQSTFGADGALTMASGVNIAMAGAITGVSNPSNPQDAATKNYVDTLLGAGGGWNDDGAVVRLFTASDRLGVGTTSPGTSKMWLQGQAADTFHLRVSSQNSTGSLFVVDRLGNVGIGTTSPSPRLHINTGLAVDTVAMRTDLTLSGYYTEWQAAGGLTAHRDAGTGGDVAMEIVNDNDAAWSGAGGGISLKTTADTRANLTTRLRVKPNGNVGIGTTDPSYRLEAINSIGITASEASGANPTLVIRDNSAAQTRVSAINFNNSADSARGQLAYNQSLDQMTFNTAGATQMTLASSGRLGLGTVNPATKLHMSSGTVTIDGNVAISLTALGKSGFGMNTPGSSVQIAGGNRATLTLDRAGAINDRFKMFVGDGTGGYTLDENYIESANTGLHFMAGPLGTSEVLSLLNTGNLGLGSTNPGASRLWVQGSGAETYHLRVSSQSGTGSLFVIDRLGRVGIGTSAPGVRMEIVEGDPADSTFRLLSGNASEHTAYGLGRTASEAYWAISSATGEWSDVSVAGDTVLRNNTAGIVLTARNAAGHIGLATGAGGSESEKMTVLNGGNVGIGATNPGRELTVNGGVQLLTATGRPACSAANRGTLWFTQAGAGVKDALEVCAKDAGDAYAWRLLY